MFFNLFSFVSFGTEKTNTIDGVTYKFNDETGELTISGTGTVTKNGVNSVIGRDEYNMNTTVKEVKIGEGITSIGNNAFAICKSLTSVTIPSNVTSIGNEAFDMCRALTEIKVEEGNKAYKSVDGVLFNKAGTELILYPISKAGTRYIIPEGVTKICYIAFYECKSLESITIPSSVKEIGQWVFSGSALKTVYYLGTEEMWRNISIGGHNSDLDNATIIYCYMELNNGTLIIYGYQEITADEVDKAIGRTDHNKANESVKTIIIKSAQSIGKDAFYGFTGLTKATIPEGVTSIGDRAFAWCPNLNNIIIPNSVTSIGNNAFAICKSLTSVTIPSNVTSIGNVAFGDCKKLTNAIIPNSVRTIGRDVFYGCTALNDVYYIGSEEEWGKMAIDKTNGTLFNTNIHCTGKTLTVKKVWNDNKEINSRREPKLVLHEDERGNSVYKPMNTSKYTKYNFQYYSDEYKTYKDVEYNGDGKAVEYGGKDEWQCKITILYYFFDENCKEITTHNKYAVSEDPMVGYTSSAPTPKSTTSQ